MGYPTTDFNPSARSNGQTIDASHVQDLQNEASAVVSALRGTITHAVTISGVVNISGASTLTTIQGGASTLASLQTGASTFTARPVMPPPDAAMVFLESTQTIGSSANSVPTFTGQSFLTNSSIHSTASNPSRLTPQSTGIYQFVAQLRTLTPSSGPRAVFIVDSSNAAIGLQRVSNSTELVLNVTGYKRFDVTGGYATLLFQTDASSHSLSTGVENSWFAMHKL